MKNREIADIFNQIAQYLELKDDNPFRIRAYRKAALNLENLSRPVEAVSEDGSLEEIPGIGKDLADKIREYLASGKVQHLDDLRKETPEGLLALLEVQGIGPRTARHLYDEFAITSLDELERLAREHKLAGLPGIQKKTEENILRGLEFLKQGKGRHPLGTALPFAEEVLERLDFVVASIHSGFSQSMEQVTQRAVAAMQNPFVDMLGHPTGRLLGQRKGYDIDMEEVIKAAKRTGTALEINAYSARLDITDVQCRRAKDAGVMAAIATDAHQTDQLRYMEYGVWVARRGWLGKKDLLNSMTPTRIRKWRKARGVR